MSNETYLVLWPDRQRVSASTLIGWACDEVADELHPGPWPTTVEEARVIFNETGSITLGKDES